MKISTSQFKNGLKIILNDQPCSIIEHEFHKPGKGQAVMRVKFRNLITDKVIDKTYKSGESVEEADILTVEMSYLYTDGEFWHFMNPSTYEQIEIPSKIIGNSKKALIISKKLEKKGFYVVPIRPPSVPPNSSRLRISITSSHSQNNIKKLFKSLKMFKNEM